MDTLESMFPGVEYEVSRRPAHALLQPKRNETDRSSSFGVMPSRRPWRSCSSRGDGDLEAAIEALLEMVKDASPAPSGSGGGRRETERLPGGAAFEVPRQHPVLERDTQIRTDEMIARRMQEQIFSEALQEQTPTCFSPITGMLGGSTAVGESAHTPLLPCAPPFPQL